MVFGDLIIDLMFIFIVIGFGLIGLGITLSTIIHGAGIIGIDLIIFMWGKEKCRRTLCATASELPSGVSGPATP